MAYKRRRYRKRRSVTKTNDFLFFGFFILIGITALVQMMVHDPRVQEFAQLLKLVTVVLVGLGILFVLWRIWHFFKDLSVEKERKARMKAWKEAKFSAARSQQQFMHMDPFEFEHYIGWLYTMYGYEVEVTQSRGDKGIDAHASRDGKEYAIQVKQYKQGNTVGRPELQQFMGSMIGYDGGIFITTSNFTTGAIEYAKDHPDLELIDGAKLLHMAQNL